MCFFDESSAVRKVCSHFWNKNSTFCRYFMSVKSDKKIHFSKISLSQAYNLKPSHSTPAAAANDTDDREINAQDGGTSNDVMFSFVHN